MASVAVVYRTDKLNKNGLAPIHLRLIKNRRVNYISCGIMLSPEFWDSGRKKIKLKHPNSAQMNAFITDKFNELQNEVLYLERTQKSLTTPQLKSKIFGKKPTNFFEFADSVVIQYMKALKVSTYDKNKSILNKLKFYTKERLLTFHDITPVFLANYEEYLKSTLGNSINTVNKDFRFIRKVFNDALKSDLIEANISPFKKYRLKSQKTHKIYLSEGELRLIEEYTAKAGSKIELHRDMFVFASYTGGIRVSDMLFLKWRYFDGHNLNFTIKKTNVQLSIKVPQKGLEILDKYWSPLAEPGNFIFPILPQNLNLNDARKTDTAKSGATTSINTSLKTIAEDIKLGKKLTFHISRHTWATRALRKGISIDKVSKLMGHSRLLETMIYAKIVSSELDKAMDAFNE